MLEQLVHTWMFGPIPLSGALDALGRVGADGVDLGVSLSAAHNSLEALRTHESQKALARCGLPVRVVTPLYKDPRLDFCHPDAAVRDNCMSFTRGCIDLAIELGAGRVLVSAGYISPKHGMHVSYEEDWGRAVQSLRAMADYAQRKNVTLMLEPINRYMVSLVHTVDEGLRMADEIGSSAVSLVPDAFHMNIEEPDGVLGGVRRAKGRIACFHLGDNNRLPPGNGCMDWAAILAELRAGGFSGPLSHEPVELYYSEERMRMDGAYRQLFEKRLKESIEMLRALLRKA